MKPSIILVTGSRDETNPDRIKKGFVLAEKALHGLLRSDKDRGPIHIYHGAARGADRIASQQGRSFGYLEKAFPADWERLGKNAGPIRNQKMVDNVLTELVDNAESAICLAFPRSGSIGTWDCIKRAHHNGLAILIVP